MHPHPGLGEVNFLAGFVLVQTRCPSVFIGNGGGSEPGNFGANVHIGLTMLVKQRRCVGKPNLVYIHNFIYGDSLLKDVKSGFNVYCMLILTMYLCPC
jgi:hypothetical protein